MINITFIKSVIIIATPIALQEILLSSNNILDNFMVGKLGTEAVAALGASSRFIELFILIVLSMAITNGTFTAQFSAKKGEEAEKGYRKSLATNLVLGGAISLSFISLYFFNRNSIPTLFTNNTNIQRLMKEYLDIIVFYSIPLVTTFAFESSLKSIKKVRITLSSAIICISSNIILNYLLIYGNFGFPALGVKGAAIATVTSEIIASMILIITPRVLGYPIKVNFKDMMNIPKEFIKQYLYMSTSMSINFLSWGLSQFVIHMMMGCFGKDALAAFGIITPIEIVFIHLFTGLGNASSVLIGKDLGDNNFNKAYTKSKEINLFTFVISMAIGIPIYFSSEHISRIYAVSPDTMMYVKNMIKILSSFLWIQAITEVLFGILASGGDFYYISNAGIAISWIITIPATYLGTYFFDWNVITIYSVARISTFVPLLLVFYLRFKSKKWMKNLTDH